MLKLKLQYFDHLMQRASLEKPLMLAKIEGRRRRGQQRTRWLDETNRHESEQTLGDGEGQGSLACCSPWGHKESDTTERLNNNPERSERWRRQDLCEEKKIRSREGKDHHSHSSWGSCQSLV